jgi:tetratricopeptide (TPR) repeat protein
MDMPVPEFESLDQFVGWWATPEVQQSLKKNADMLLELSEHSKVKPWLDEFLKAVLEVNPEFDGEHKETLELLTTSTGQNAQFVSKMLSSWRQGTTWDTGEEPRSVAKMPAFGRYRNLRKVGQGGFGTVYEAYDPELDRTVALKLFRFRSPDEMEQFRKEAKLAAKLRHPNIISVHEYGVIDNQPYYTMDLFEGKTLRDLLDDRGRIPANEAFGIASTLADALSFAHANGILHRDMKPANIFIDSEGRTYIGDFGVAKQVEDLGKQATTSRIVGTPYYMSPEQTDCRPLDARSDIWAIGIILYKMLCDAYPFEGKTASDLFTKIWLNEPVPPRKHNHELDRDTETIVLKCLEKEPARRYQSAADLKDDIERYLNGEPIHARPIGIFEKLWRRMKHHKTASISVVSAVLIVAVVAIALWMQSAARRTEAARLLSVASQAFENRDFEKALEFVSKSLALADDDEEAQALKAGCDSKMAEKTRRQEARRKAEEIMETLPIATTLSEKLQILDDAIEADPAWLPPRVGKGELLKDVGRNVEAQEIFDEAIKVARGGADTNGEALCCFYKAMIYWQQEEYQKALLFFGNVLQLMPNVRNPKTLYAQAAKAYFKKHFDQALNLLEEALRLDTKFADAYNSRGMILHAQGKLDEAIVDYTRAVKLKPHFWFYDNRGVARRDKGELDGAIDDFIKAIEHNSKDPRVYINRGIAYHIKGELDKAVADFTKASVLAEAADDKKTAAGALTNRGNATAEKANSSTPLPTTQKQYFLTRLSQPHTAIAPG